MLPNLTAAAPSLVSVFCEGISLNKVRAEACANLSTLHTKYGSLGLAPLACFP